MDNLIYPLFVSIFVPILLMTLLVENKARLPMAFVLTGMFASLFASELNGFLRSVFLLDPYVLTVVAAPITEEVLKALPILFAAAVLSDKYEMLFTASMATGIGFAILENAFYLINSVSFHLIDAVIRAFGAGLMHGMCTLLVGVGISFMRRKRKIFFVGTFALLATAITYHGIYNMLIQSRYAAVGALLPIATYVPFFIRRLKHKRVAADKGSAERC